MSVTTEDWLEAYTKDDECYRNIEGIKVGLESLYKSIIRSDYYKQMQAWQAVLNNPESSINKSMQMWFEFSKKFDLEKLTGLQTGLRQLAEQMPKFDMSAFTALQTNLDKMLNTENIISHKLSEGIDYAYEAAKEEAGEPNISKEELKDIIKEEIKNDTLGEAVIENNKFKEKFYQVIKFILVNIMLPLALSFVYDLGIAKLGEVIKASDNENAPVIYEIQNENTYVNIVDQTDKQYHVYFIDDEGNIIDGYTSKENIDTNFEEDE